ncbi:capsid triplex subunit 1 [Beluga whale alphaherpesvirus 1]|uniref:Capsid triplex subunit 1 n=1 Tax=Beluga whale alphaherpesvirus 1 TaxID=1434720 RepID=A0A286MM42_9ALPH|nr:capsid triplex subunit 1 [Beluga whale alphaherpesvirus 1]ASW27068.1 capsid triplex subunit 1 [Beluga whale alphaherpesvirus 1]
MSAGAGPGNAFIQIGDGLRMFVGPHGPRASGPGRAGVGPVPGGGPGYDEWANGMLHVSAPTVSIQNMTGVQILGSGQVSVHTPEGSVTLSMGNQPYLKLTRHVTLTDFCDPQTERPGALILTLRHPNDIVGMAVSATPPGRQPRDVERAWKALTDLSNYGADCAGGLRASLVSLTFLVAACSAEYADRAAAESVRAHVVASFGGRDIQGRLDRLYECMRVMVRCHVFPHRACAALGGLLTWIAQDRLASVTAVVRGMQEDARTDQTGAPRSTFHVPVCAFLDLDAELKLEPEGAKFVYLVFVYGQRLNHEGFRVHVAVSSLNPQMIGSALGFLLHRTRSENVLRGTAGAAGPDGGGDASFPLEALARNPASPRCPVYRLRDADATRDLFQWSPDMRGRPTASTCMYAAYARMGWVPSDRPRVSCRSERYRATDVTIVSLEGLTWNVGEWVACYY